MGMVDTEKQLNQARLELREAERARDAYRRGLSEDPGSQTNDTSVMLVEVDGRIDTQRRALDQLLQRYTEDHPDVQGNRRVIRELEEQKKGLMEQRKREGSATGTASPVPLGGRSAYESLK